MNRQERLDIELDDAVNRADLDEVKQLLLQGANIESRDSFGMTPLMNAAWVAAVDIVEYMLAEGADMNAKDNNGKTALDLVREIGHNDFGHNDVIAALEKHGK